MGVMLQAFYRMGTHGVPSPADGGPNTPWWWDRMASQALELRRVGFTAIWLPPVLKGASGTFSVGYDTFDDYDLGAKDQHGTVPTRYGTREQLTRLIATLRACGLEVYVDLVENQRAGGIGFRYRYKDSVGGDGGRFPKDPEHFHPNVPQDPNVFGGPHAREIEFGDDLAIITARPPGYVRNHLVAAAGWLTRALDIQGYRLDYAKGISTDFIPQLLNTPPMAGKYAVGEFFDGNRDLIRAWIATVGHRSAGLDFPLRFTLARMCQQTGGFDMGGSLDHAGLAGADPLGSVTFVENHDTDNRGELIPIIANKLLAYAYILTSEGYPCVYYRDYARDPGCYGLKPFIDNLIWIHEKLAAGPTVERWKQVGLFIFERLWEPHLLVGLNKDDWQWRTVTVDTGFGPNAHLHDYTGQSGDVWTDWRGQATISIPPNQGGRGYVCYSRDGIGFGFDVRELPVTQELEGAPDLDIPPAGADQPSVAGRVWVEQGKTLHVEMRRLDTAGFGAASRVEVAIEGPNNTSLGARPFKKAGDPALAATALQRGWHRITVHAKETPAQNRRPSFTLAVTYTAPQTGP